MIGVKGRVQSRIITQDDGNKKKKTEIVAEKVTFLAQAPKKKEETKVNKSEKKADK